MSPDPALGDGVARLRVRGHEVSRIEAFLSGSQRVLCKCAVRRVVSFYSRRRSSARVTATFARSAA